MKTLLKLIVVTQIFYAATAGAQGLVGDGGHPVRAKFRNTGQMIYRNLVNQNFTAPRLDLNRFYDAVIHSNLVVQDVERLTNCEGRNTGVFVACANSHTNTITIAGRGYMNLAEDQSIQKTAHEFLNVMSYGDGSYTVSLNMLNAVYETYFSQVRDLYGDQLDYRRGNKACYNLTHRFVRSSNGERSQYHAYVTYSNYDRARNFCEEYRTDSYRCSFSIESERFLCVPEDQSHLVVYQILGNYRMHVLFAGTGNERGAPARIINATSEQQLINTSQSYSR